MTYEIDAIFNNGAFVPVDPIAIPEGAHVHLRVDEQPAPLTVSPGEERPKLSRAEMEDFLRTMEELPIESPDDGFSAEDHDKVIYRLP
jgi:predicted DNA-binding antitoxin AbrB/MazE fold protein